MERPCNCTRQRRSTCLTKTRWLLYQGSRLSDTATTPQRTKGNANHQQKDKPNELSMSESENESEGENNQPTPPTPPETPMIDPNSRQRPCPIEPTCQLNLQQRANTKSTEESTIHRTNATDSSTKPSNNIMVRWTI